MIHVLYVNMIIPRICTIHSYVPNRSIFSTRSKSWKVTVHRFLPIENRLPISPFFTNPHILYYMGPAQWGPAFVGLWATRRRSKDVPAAFCCDKDSDSSPLGARTFNFPPSPPQFTDQWSRFLGLTRSLQRRWKFQEFSGYFSVLKWRQNYFSFSHQQI